MSRTLSVIHKQVFRVNSQDVLQEFSVPVNAELLAIEWDAHIPNGIAFWYRFDPPLNGIPDDFGPMRTWYLTIRVTGQTFTPALVHLRTLVKEGYAYHLFNAGSTTDIRWADK